MLNEDEKTKRLAQIAERQRVVDRIGWWSDGYATNPAEDEFCRHAPGDIAYLFAVIHDLTAQLKELRTIHNRTADIFDALGIWTGADDLLWDRLEYLLSGMGGYCDPMKTKAILERNAEWLLKGR